MKSYIIASVAMLILSFSAQAEDYCIDVIRYAAYDFDMKDLRNNIVKNLYDKACDGSQSKQNFTFTSGIEAIIESIPIKGTAAAHRASCRDFRDSSRVLTEAARVLRPQW